MTELVGLGAAFAVALVATRGIEAGARRRALYAPTSSRGAHVHPTPRLGGAAIAAGTIIGLALAVGAFDGTLAVILVGGAVLLATGIVDDLRTLPVLPRYLVQLLVAGVTSFALAPEFAIVLPGVALHLGGWPAIVLAALWITAMVNVFNFMDGIDGMVAGTVAATMPAALVMGGGVADALAIGIAGACLGFLVWNHHPASIFMGDGGSQFLGYAVSAAFLVQPRGELQAIPILLAVAPFLIDAFGTLARRSVSRENVFRAHNGHLYQRLVRHGASQRLVAAAYAVLALAAGWCAIAYSDASAWVQAGVIGACVLAGVFVATNIPRAD